MLRTLLEASQERWKDDIALGVLFTAFLTIKELFEPLVLRNCPLNHLECPARPKYGCWQRLRGEGKQHPAPDLKRVIGTRDDVEQATAGNGIPCG